MVTKMQLNDYRIAIGLTDSEMAHQIQEFTGTHISINLIRGACTYKEAERPAIAAKKAEAIAAFLTEEFGRPISVSDIDGLKVV